MHVLRVLREKTGSPGVLPTSIDETRHQHGNMITIKVRALVFRMETIACNDLHERLAGFLAQSSNETIRRSLHYFYSVGSIVCILGLLAGLLLLAWTPVNALYAFYFAGTETDATTLTKRAFDETPLPTADGEVDFGIKPIVSNFQ